MKLLKLEFILVVIPIIATVSLGIFLHNGSIQMADFWVNLTYFLLAGIFIPIGTLITLRLAQHKIGDEKRYDVKKLNNEVFKKLMRVVCLESQLFFENRFGFCIPKNPIVFENKADSFALAWFVKLEKNKDFEKEFDNIDDVIPSLKIGEKYLEKNYKKVYTLWRKIKHELEQINNERDEFFISIAKRIGKDLKKDLNYESKFLLDPFGDETVFFEDNIKKIIPILFDTYLINFTIESNIKNQYYVRYGDSYIVIGSNKKEKLNMSAIEIIFKNTFLNYDSIHKYGDFHHRLITLNKVVTEFCNQLENDVVNDIDNIL